MVEAATASAPPVAVPAIRALFPLDGRYHAGSGVALTPGAPRTLIALHLAETAFGPVGDALGVSLPRRPKASAASEGIAALWLGPDDVMLVSDDAGDDAPDALIERIEAAGGPDVSPVDVSDRFTSIVVEGLAAEAVLAVGCPRDLRPSSFPVGAASRTVFARSEVTLWRTGEARFEVICGRSFADYVWGYLIEASRAPAV